MNIAFITSTLGSGGAERVLVGYANYFSRKHNVFILRFDSARPFYDIEDKVKLISLDLYRESHSPLTRLLNIFKRIYSLRKILVSIKPDIVISFQTQTNLYSVIACSGFWHKLSLWEQINHRYETDVVTGALRRLLYRLAGRIVVLSEFDRRYYSKFKKETFIIYNYVSIKVPQKNNFVSKERIILNVGRLCRQKNQEKLVDMFSAIRDKNSYKLLIIGDGDLREKIKLKIAKNKIQECALLLPARKDIETFYAKSRIFCLTSIAEGFPNVLIEAMSWGCVPIAFDCLTGPSEIIDDGVDGFLVKNFDETQYISRLDCLIKDEALLERMSLKAFEKSKKFYKEEIFKKAENFLGIV